MFKIFLFSLILISKGQWILSQSNETGCQIPKFPKKGKIEVFGFEDSNVYISGNYVDKSTVISVKCNKGYRVKGNSVTYCHDGKWGKAIGECSVLCHPFINTKTYTVSCNLNGANIDCARPVDGTKAQFKCQKFYETDEILAERVCIGGNWNLPIPNCRPECGTRPMVDNNEEKLSPVEHPWHLGIHKKKKDNDTYFQYICGGTLIAPNVIITTPECVNEKSHGEVVIVAGKYYTDLNDTRDDSVQINTVKKIAIPPVYKGEELNYVGSYAIVTTEKPFELNAKVKPVCIDWEDKYRNELVNPRMTGIVYGWGWNSSQKLSDELRRVQAPIITEGQCMENVPEDFRKYIAYDKFCAGFLNNTQGVCRGFTGGALAVQNQRDGKFYGIGVVVLAPVSTKIACGTLPLVVYTNSYEYLTLTAETVKEQEHIKSANSGCVLPQHPENGRWVLQDNANRNPGDRVASGSSLKISCRDERYEIVGNPVSICSINDEWNENLGKCQIFCPPLVSTDTMSVSCEYRGENVSCLSRAENGTKASFKCATFHQLEIEYTGGNSDKVECIEGSWGVQKYKCSPVCGTQPNPDIYPWHVAIYRQEKSIHLRYICGGTLIAQNVILSVGHCFVDHFSPNRTLPKERVTVAVGKYHLDENAESSIAQYSRLKQLTISRMFKGVELVFLGDLAVLVTEKTFPLSSRIQPICVDWDKIYKNVLIKPGNVGHLPGWGYDETGTQPDKLKSAKQPILERDACYQYLTKIRTYLTYEKICAGFSNGSAPQVCQGDSGGGLAIQNPLANDRFYLVALLSVAEHDNSTGCGAKPVALYTNIYEHIKCVAKTIKRLNQNPKDKGSCILPEHPENGHWSLYGVVGEFLPGDDVDSGVNLFVNCDDLYEVNGNPSAVCHNGTWSNIISSCDLFCPALHEKSATFVTCKTSVMGEKANCLKPTHRTIANFTCAPFYELATDKYGNEFPPEYFELTCENGKWNRKIPKCVPICGQKTVEPELLVINGSVASINDYPWQVIIYLVDKNTGAKKFHCGGSLLGQKFVLTAAHCVTTSAGSPHPTDLFEVAVGKHFQKYNETKDAKAQFSSVAKIELSSFYRGIDQNYLADIAILTMKVAFQFSKRVQPVCVDWTQKIIGKILARSNTKGFVSGWGYTEESGKPSEVLKEVEVPLIPQSQCKERLPSEFLVYFTHDKLCAGFYQQSTGVCRGDSGGALVVRNSKNDRYYASGIVSLTPKAQGEVCDSQRYTLYTQVLNYTNFLQTVTNLMP